jgi:predicted RNA-binding Zn-ribbon protein involved in translation (DUF1610 family)
MPPLAHPALSSSPASENSTALAQSLDFVTVCAWCGRTMGRCSTIRRTVTHGICRSCSDEALFSDEAAQIVPR